VGGERERARTALARTEKARSHCERTDWRRMMVLRKKKKETMLRNNDERDQQRQREEKRGRKEQTKVRR